MRQLALITGLLFSLFLAGCSSSPEVQKSRAEDVGFYSILAAIRSLAGSTNCTACGAAMEAGAQSASKVYKN